MWSVSVSLAVMMYDVGGGPVAVRILQITDLRSSKIAEIFLLYASVNE